MKYIMIYKQQYLIRLKELMEIAKIYIKSKNSRILNS